MTGAYHGTGGIMRNKTQVAATTARLLENARYEVLPTASIEDKLLEHVPVDRTITVTASPSSAHGSRGRASPGPSSPAGTPTRPARTPTHSACWRTWPTWAGRSRTSA